MRIIPTEIPEVYLLELQIYRDERGFFTETYCKRKFEAGGIAVPHTGYAVPMGCAVDFVQDNYSGSHQGVLRGLHYQLHQAQGKLVLVVVGEIYDVAVDVRKNSPTFGKWVGTRLTANKQQLYCGYPQALRMGFMYSQSGLRCITKPRIIMRLSGSAPFAGMTRLLASPGRFWMGLNPVFLRRMQMRPCLRMRKFMNSFFMRSAPYGVRSAPYGVRSALYRVRSMQSRGYK